MSDTTAIAAPSNNINGAPSEVRAEVNEPEQTCTDANSETTMPRDTPGENEANSTNSSEQATTSYLAQLTFPNRSENSLKRVKTVPQTLFPASQAPKKTEDEPLVYREVLIPPTPKLGPMILETRYDRFIDPFGGLVIDEGKESWGKRNALLAAAYFHSHPGVDSPACNKHLHSQCCIVLGENRLSPFETGSFSA